MRSTVVKGNDGFRLELGSNTDLIGEVIELGKVVDYLIFEVEMTGVELIEFLKRHHLDNLITQNIKQNNKYTVTSYDW